MLSRPRVSLVRRGSWRPENLPPGFLRSKNDLRPSLGQAGFLSPCSPRCGKWAISVESATGARGRGCGGVLLLGPLHRVRPPVSAATARSCLFPRCHRIRLTRREGSQRSASEASGKAGNSAAPARRPAPSPGPAPRWKAAIPVAGQRWGKSLPRSLSPLGSSRAPRPRALCGSRGPTGGALRRSCRWARSGGSGGVGRYWRGLRPARGSPSAGL